MSGYGGLVKIRRYVKEKGENEKAIKIVEFLLIDAQQLCCVWASLCNNF